VGGHRRSSGFYRVILKRSIISIDQSIAKNGEKDFVVCNEMSYGQRSLLNIAPGSLSTRETRQSGGDAPGFRSLYRNPRWCNHYLRLAYSQEKSFMKFPCTQAKE
jgi:hypothetical protein